MRPCRRLGNQVESQVRKRRPTAVCGEPSQALSQNPVTMRHTNRRTITRRIQRTASHHRRVSQRHTRARKARKNLKFAPNFSFFSLTLASDDTSLSENRWRGVLCIVVRSTTGICASDALSLPHDSGDVVFVMETFFKVSRRSEELIVFFFFTRDKRTATILLQMPRRIGVSRSRRGAARAVGR
jgi:hypothetical protein